MTLNTRTKGVCVSYLDGDHVHHLRSYRNLFKSTNIEICNDTRRYCTARVRLMKKGILLLFSFSQGKIWLKTMRKQQNCFLLQEEENKMNEIKTR